MQPEMISLHLDPDETRPHKPYPPRRPPPPQPAIVGIMNRVGLWGLWLVCCFGAYTQLVLFRGAGLWSKSSLYFFGMMLIVGYMATKKDSLVLETASFVMITVTLMLVL